MINNDGSTALMHAAINNRESMDSFLIDRGADINMKNNNVSDIVFIFKNYYYYYYYYYY